jgi:hypothetical protein
LTWAIRFTGCDLALDAGVEIADRLANAAHPNADGQFPCLYNGRSTGSHHSHGKGYRVMQVQRERA